jgi:hypothetical protein
MGCRKNQANLTGDERKAFVDAVLALKNSVPSQMGLSNRYDDYVMVHMNAMMATVGWAHQMPAFLPWHREYLRHFELDLQKVNPTVTIPYWDWSVNQNPSMPDSPFTDDFMGGNGDPADNRKVTTGMFAFSKGKWKLNVISGHPGDTVNYLRREFGAVQNEGIPVAPTLPSPTQVEVALNETFYEISRHPETQPVGFRNRIEGWLSTGHGPDDRPPQLHNRVHVWVGGTMLPMTSPNDPIFWLNHCNVDRLWAVWQGRHPTSAPYLPVAGAPSGHNLNDSMIFYEGGPSPWSDVSTPAGVVNHHALGYWYETDSPQIILKTPSLSFIDVQEGVGGTGLTRYRGIKFELQSCGDVLLQITAGPTAGFGAPSLSETVRSNHEPSAGLVPNYGRLWVSYTSTTAGSSITGSVTVQAVDIRTGTVFGPWVVNLSANTVARQASAVTLVLDRSGSMSSDAGNGNPRVELLRTAVSTFIDVMRQGDGLGIVRFDNLVDAIMPVTDVGPIPSGPGRVQAHSIVTSHDPSLTLDPRGSTSIGGGIQKGKATLDAVATTYPKRAMIVLTDGLENTTPMIADVGSSLNDHTFAIGFGQAASISTAALNAITQNHGGYLIITGSITPSENFALTEYFLKIQAGINNSTAVLDPRGELVFGATHRIPFTVTKADIGLDVVLLSPAPYYINFKLETPAGGIIDPGKAGVEPAIQYIVTSRVSYYRCSLPMLPADPSGSHSGQWHVLLSLGDRAKNADKQFIAGLKSASLPYSLLINANSNLQFRPNVTQSSFETGATVNVSVAIDQYDVPLERPVSAWAEITWPDSRAKVLNLAQSEQGRFTGSFSASLTGVYTVFVRAKGVTLEGQTFEREQKFTATVFSGGDNKANPSPKDKDDCLCNLLGCLLRSNIISPETEKELEVKGISVKALKKCLDLLCQKSDTNLGGEREYSPSAATHSFLPGDVDASQFLKRDDVKKMVFEIQKELAAQPSASQFADLVEAKPHEKPFVPKMIMNFGLDLGHNHHHHGHSNDKEKGEEKGEGEGNN